MCLAVPGEIVEIEEDGLAAVVELGGVRQRVGLMLLDGVERGDFVLVHAGFAIEKVDPQEARETLRLLEELAGFDEIPG